MDTRQIIDYAANDNAKEMRDALYSGIHDRVMQHIDAKKVEVARNILQPAEAQLATAQDTPIENT
jgi:hypothetical protein